jgi:threonine synthase
MTFRSVMLRCHGCSTLVDPIDPFLGGATAGFRCPNASRAPKIDHVMEWDPIAAGVNEWPFEQSINPFVRYRTLHHSYWLARARGLSDEAYVERVLRIDRAIAGVAGTGFLITPFGRLDAASEALGVEVWAKDETGNVTGTHKARHLMGLAIHLDIEKVSIVSRLAIASCGNAALAAATIAQAVRRPIDVFVPSSAKASVLEQLRSLGARVHETTRRPESAPGDPCVHAFHEAVAKGALPFCVQGNENGLTIDGGTTIGQELADQLAVNEISPTRLMLHVGGGAFGTAVTRGLGHAALLGRIEGLPPTYCVQPEACAPLRRAWAAVANRALSALGDDLRAYVSGDLMTGPEVLRNDAAVATRLIEPDAQEALAAALQFAVSNRPSHMWAWDSPGQTIASAIVDDETYDWFALVGVMLCTGGFPIIVNDEQLRAANGLSHSTADESGTADLAGLLALKEAALLTNDDVVVTVLSGVRRS